MLAVSSWIWVAAASLAVLSLAVLTRISFGLLRRLKELNRSLQGASGKLNEVLDDMKGDLDRTSEGLATLRQRREGPADRP